jgi:hypothetical protein
MEEQNEQSSKQRKIILAQSDNALTVLELMKDCMIQGPIIVNSEWGTIVNAITLDVQGTMLRKMADYLEEIRQGSLHEPQP